MPKKSKIPPAEKIQAVEAYLDGKLGFTEACKKHEINGSVWRAWVRLYKTYGSEGLVPQARNRKYSKELKMQVVIEYLGGEISLLGLCSKYRITNHSQVQQWIKRYIGQKGFKNPNSGSEIHMTKGRETALEERIEIVSSCIENEKDYARAVEKYQVSYQQIYSWVHKYEEFGVDKLIDKRGKRKSFEEMTEVERLRAELRLLTAENSQKDMEIDILKKVQEVERRRG